jgi:hypothetical protein
MAYDSSFLDCTDCGQPFPFSIAQQALYAELGYEWPRRCPNCRRSLENSRLRLSPISDPA